MNWKAHVSFFLLLSSLTFLEGRDGQRLSISEESINATAYTLQLGGYMFTLPDAYEKYSENNNDIQMRCVTCGERTINNHYISGGLIGTALREVGEMSPDFFCALKHIGELFEVYMHGSRADLLELVVTICDEGNFFCTKCQGTLWVPESA